MKRKIFGLMFVLALVFALPLAANAEESYPFQVGDQTYAKLSNIPSGSTVTLLRDATIEVEDYVWYEITLDLNGHNLTYKGDFNISENFKLTGAGTLSAQKITIVYGTTILTGTTKIQSIIYLAATGSLTVSGAEAEYVFMGSTGIVSVEDNGKIGTISASSSGTINIKSGTVETIITDVLSNNHIPLDISLEKNGSVSDITIEGKTTFSMRGGTVQYLTCKDDSSIKIYNGTVDSASIGYNVEKAYIYNGKFGTVMVETSAEDNVTIAGGTFGTANSDSSGIYTFHYGSGASNDEYKLLPEGCKMVSLDDPNQTAVKKGYFIQCKVVCSHLAFDSSTGDCPTCSTKPSIAYISDTDTNTNTTKTTYYKDLKSLFENLKDGSVVTFYCVDEDGSRDDGIGMYPAFEDDLTVDLGGKNVTIDLRSRIFNSAKTDENGSAIAVDFKISNGTLTFNNTAIGSNDGQGSFINVKIQVGSGATLNVNTPNTEYAGKVTVQSGGTLKVTNGTFTDLLISNGANVSLSGGTYTKIAAEDTSDLRQFLADDYAYKSNGTWYCKDDSDAISNLTNFSVVNSPIKKVFVSGYNEENPYNTVTRLSASSRADAYHIDYSWSYDQSLNSIVKVDSGSMGAAIVFTKPLPVGTHKFKLTAHATEIGARFTKSFTIKVVKADLEDSDGYSNPTILNIDGLHYNGAAQQLIKGGETNEEGVTFYYRLGKNGDFTTDVSQIAAKNAGTYPVQFYAVGNENYNGIGSAEKPITLNITINPVDITKEYPDGTEVRIDSKKDFVFDGLQHMITVKSVGLYINNNLVETLTEGTDYTLDHGGFVLNAGSTKTTSVNGKGNYTATVALTASVTKAAAPSVNAINIYCIKGQPTKFTLTNAIPANAIPISFNFGSPSNNVICSLDNEDAIVTHSGNSTETLTFTVTSKNYEDITFNLNFILVTKPLPTLSVEDYTAEFSADSISINSLTRSATVDGKEISGEWCWVGNAPRDVGTRKYNVQFVPNDSTYGTTQTTVTVTVTPKALKGAPTFKKITKSDKTIADAKVTANSNWPNGLLLVGEDVSNFTELSPDSIVSQGYSYAWKFIPYDVNYSTLTGEFVLYPNSTSKPSAPADDPTDSEESTVLPNGSTVTVVSDETKTTITVTDKNGSTVAKVDLPAAPENGKTFTDVKDGAWFKNNVDKAVGYGLFSGMSETTFGPRVTMTRGMLARVLYNLSGETGYGTDSSLFADVSSKRYYSDAIGWATAIGVVNGVGADKFEPETEITREQLVVMLYRYAQAIGAANTATADISNFPDASKVSAYAKEAMQWAVANGIIGGTTSPNGTVLAPRGTATRAEVATVLVRFIEYLK